MQPGSYSDRSDTQEIFVGGIVRYIKSCRHYQLSILNDLLDAVIPISPTLPPVPVVTDGKEFFPLLVNMMFIVLFIQ